MNILMNVAMIATLVAFMQQCGKEDIAPGTPDCVQRRIKDISQNEVWNPPAKVYSYHYKGSTVYLISQHCCDVPSELLDKNCNRICSPDGGFSGGGDGKCLDFFDTRTQELLIWEDTRSN